MNLFAMLAAARQTDRPELFNAFKSRLDALVDSGEPIPADFVKALGAAVTSASLEAYDLRRTVKAMIEANKYIGEAIGGVMKNAWASTAVANQGLTGTLPDIYAPGDLIAEAKKILVEESGEG